MENFKIQGVGIDTSNLSYSISEGHENYGYVHTSLKSNNDFLLNNYVGTVLKDAPLIVSTTFLDKLDLALSGHLLNLNRNAIDLLLVDSKCNISKYINNIKGVLDSGMVYQVGIHCSGDLEELQKAIEDIKSIMVVRYISIDICPLNFDYDIITWANEKNLDIIGFNPFGGRLSSGVIIESFTVPYLLGFAANYCDVVLLSSRDMYKSDEQASYLTQLIGEESNPKYILKKSAKKSVKPLKKIVKSSLKISDENIIPFNSPEAIFNTEELVLTLGNKNNEKITLIEDDLTKEVNEYINMVQKPEDGDWIDYNTILRPKVRLLLKSILGEEYNILSTSVTDTINVFIITKTIKNKKWYNRKKDTIETKNYAFCCTPDNVVFFKIENSSQNSSES